VAGRPNEVHDKDLGWLAILQQVEALAGGAYAKVGVLEDDPKGSYRPKGGLTVAEIAAVQEFGTEDGHVPERSFLRSTFDEMRDTLDEMSRKLIIAVVLDRTLTVEQALNLLGAKFAAAVRAKITDGEGVPPPNAPSTRARKEAKGRWNVKGAAAAAGLGVRTLVDTARMIGAITWALVGTSLTKRTPKAVAPASAGAE
jgi:hypothetical protein